MKASEELREKMWELCYDLLPDDERRALVANIKSDPQAARLYAEVRLQADLVGYASKVEDSSLILSPEGKKPSETDLAPAAGRHKEVLQPAPKRAAASPAAKTSWIAWLPAAAALSLLALIGYGTLRPNVGRHQLADAIVTEVEVPGLMQPGLSNKVRLRSLRMDGDPAPGELDVKLVDRLGEVQYHQVVQANEQGEVTFDVPGQAVAEGVRIEAAARFDGLARDGYQPMSGAAGQLEPAQVVSAPLPVAADDLLTYVIQDKPSPQPGEPTRYALYSLSRFGFEMQPADGREMAEKQVAAKEQSVKQLGELDRAIRIPVTRMKRSLADGVVEGTFDAAEARLPEMLALRQETKDNTGTLADQISPGQPGEGQAQGLEAGPRAGSGAARTYQERLNLEAEDVRLAQKFYRRAPRRNVQMLDALAMQIGKSQPTKDAEERERLTELEAGKGGAAVKQEADENAAGKKSLVLERFSDEKLAGTKAKELPAGHARSFQRQVDAEPVIVSAGAPVTITVPADLAGKRLLVEALCRDVTVASAAVEPAAKSLSVVEGKLAKNEAETTTRDSAAEGLVERQVTLQLPPEVDGDIRVMLVDASQSPPQIVREERLYRRPARELRIALAEAKSEFKPGEKVAVKVRVLSEHDQPEAALLGVRVWREDAIEASGQEPVMLADHVRSHTTLYESSGYANASVRGLAQMRKSDRSLARALAMQFPRQQMAELKKADGATTEFMEASPQGAAAPLPPAPADAPTLTRGDAQAAAVVVDPAAVAPPAPAAETPAPEGAIGDRLAGLAFGAAAMPAESSPESASQDFSLALDALAETAAAFPVLPQIVSNRDEIARQQAAAAAQDTQAWEAWRAVVGRVLVIGGLAALAGLFALFLLRTPVRAGSGTLALVGGVASLLVGAFWIADGRQATQIAGLPEIKAGAEARSPAVLASNFGSASEGDKSFGGGMGGGETPLATTTPMEDESLQQESAAARSKDAAPAGPGGLGGFGQEPAAPADGRDPLAPGGKPGIGGGGLGGGRLSKSGVAGELEAASGPANANAPTRGALRPKQPVPADTDLANTDKFAAEKSRPDDAAKNRGGSPKLEMARGGQGDQPPALPRAAATDPQDNARPGGGGRPAGDAKTAADGFAAPAATPPAPAAAPASPAIAAAVVGEDRKSEEGERNAARRGRASDAAPVTLYFNPRLETDADGYATIEFQMPAAEADYRILIDAFGHGRIGSAEMLIMCRK